MKKPLPHRLEGDLTNGSKPRIAIVAARFNELIVDRLLEGALGALTRHGIPEGDIFVTRVPGAWELSPICRRLAKSGQFDAIVTLGAVIRGATAHFDFVAGEAARGAAAVQDETGVPVIFGVLTTDTIEQALERAGTKAGNKGYDCALAALEMANLGKKLADFGV